MHYTRVISRNGLQGDYTDIAAVNGGAVRGDLRRLEADSLDDVHIKGYALIAGCSQRAARKLLRAFLGMGQEGCKDCARSAEFSAGGNCSSHSAIGVRSS